MNKSKTPPFLLLLGHTDGPSPPSSGLGVLSTHSDTPVVTETPVGADLLQTLQVLTELVVEEISHHLAGLAWKETKNVDHEHRSQSMGDTIA